MEEPVLAGDKDVFYRMFAEASDGFIGHGVVDRFLACAQKFQRRRASRAWLTVYSGVARVNRRNRVQLVL